MQNLPSEPDPRLDADAAARRPTQAGGLSHDTSGGLEHTSARSGDACPAQCGGRLFVRTGRAVAEYQRQILVCDGCRRRWFTLVPLSEIRRRKQRTAG